MALNLALFQQNLNRPCIWSSEILSESILSNQTFNAIILSLVPVWIHRSSYEQPKNM